MHVDGGVGGQFFVAPAALMAATSDYRLPATAALYRGQQRSCSRDFQVVERSTPTILAQVVGIAVKVDTRLMLDRAYVVAKRSGVGFNVASIPPSFNAPSRGAFDPDYMRALVPGRLRPGQKRNTVRQPNRRPIRAGRRQISSENRKTGANR